jgi:DNA-directed RNA polymerase subunit RPC12/RpoP
MGNDLMEKALIGGMMAIVTVAVMAQFVQGITPQPQYTCPICGAKFATQAELDEHMRTAHPTPLGYSCPYCGATFATLDELVSHVASEHPDKPPVLPITITWE